MMCGRFDSFSFFLRCKDTIFLSLTNKKTEPNKKKSPLAQALHAMTCKKSYFLTIF